MIKQPAWLFDVDGTLALRRPGGRGPYDWDRVSEDLPNEPVFAVAHALIDAGDAVVFASGRSVVCFEATAAFLDEHLKRRLPRSIIDRRLFMRPDTQEWRYARDVDLKRWIYRHYLALTYRICGVFDDRDQVVDLWRNELQLPTFQVSNGNF